MKLKKFVLLLFYCSSVIFGKETQNPNIVFVLADDLGWDDVSFHGSMQIPTPNLDALAYDGILLGNYYVQPICTPTRGALMTGRHPVHLGLQRSVIVGASPYGLGLDETIMPQYLQKLGYSTHIVGKWHLGFYDEAHTPTERGFQTHFGYFTGAEDYWDHTSGRTGRWGLDFRRNGEVVKTAYGDYSTELFTQEAESVIRNHDTSQPLYLYLAQQAVHSANGWKPLEAPWKYYSQLSHIKDKNRRTFAAMVMALDDSVGNVTKALHERGMLNNTIIAFSTDNGGPAAGFDWNHASNAPLRGLKASVWEGGMRGNGFLWSPLLKKSGYTAHQMMQVIDWLPTLLNAAGYDMNTLPSNIDGIDQWEVLSQNSSSFRTEMLHNIEDNDNQKAIRVRNMKLVYCEKGTTPQWDKWYVPEQLAHHTWPHVDYWDFTDSKSVEQMEHMASKVEEAWQSVHKNPTVKETAPSHMFKSQLDGVLRSIGRPRRTGKPFVIDCGERPDNFSANCNVSAAPCLFDIEQDPCEYNNLASQMPGVVRLMLQRIEQYNTTAVPPRNKPEDPAGLPDQHGGIWVPWIKDEF